VSLGCTAKRKSIIEIGAMVGEGVQKKRYSMTAQNSVWGKKKQQK
jgi:hypothetical protein